MGSTSVAGLPSARPPVRRRTRPALTVCLALGALLVAIVASLAIGSGSTTPGEVWQALVAPTGAPADIIVRDLRVPRTLLGAIVGAALGVAGVLMQGHTRNPLADPGLLGISGGAAFCVVLATTLLGVTDVAGFAFLGDEASPFAGALGFSSPLSLPYALDRMTPELARVYNTL